MKLLTTRLLMTLLSRVLPTWLTALISLASLLA